jgi:hypothetical protein
MSLTKVSYSMIDGAVFNVLDYDAAGDGTTDDTVAIQGAIDAAETAGGGTVYFPAGIYKLTNTVNLKANVRLQGAGRRVTYLKQFTNSKKCLAQSNTSYYNDMSDISFTVNAGVTGATLVQLEGGSTNIQNCNFVGAATGLVVSATYYVNLWGCEFGYQTSRGIQFSGSGGANSNSVSATKFGNITGDCISISSGTYSVNIQGCAFEVITGYGVNSEASIGTIIGCYFEAISIAAININGSNGMFMANNYFADNGLIVQGVSRGFVNFNYRSVSGDAIFNWGGFTNRADGADALLTNEGSSVDKVWTMTKTSINAAGGYGYFNNLRLSPIAPASANDVSVYVSNVDGKLYFKDASSVSHALY